MIDEKTWKAFRKHIQTVMKKNDVTFEEYANHLLLEDFKSYIK